MKKMADVAWSPIVTEDGVIGVGETVTRDKLHVDKDEYNLLKESGAIRDQKYPKGLGPYESPREMNLRKLNEAIQEAADNAYASIDFTNEETTIEEPASAPS